MARKDLDYILESFTDFLSDNVEGFSNLPWKYQFNFAKLAFKVLRKRHKHIRYENYASITYQELRSKFGRKFIEINKKLGLFDITDDWSKRDKYTRGVRLTDKMQTVMTAYYECNQPLSELINSGGNYMRSLPKSVFDDSVNITFRKNTSEIVTLAVNFTQLNHLINYLIAVKNVPNLNVKDTLQEARMIKKNCHTTVAGEHNLILRYGETRTGRLRGKNVFHLQGVRNAITDACLHGLPKYDIENCHWVIFRSFALRINIQLPAVDNYIANKKAIREQIARDIGIDIKIVKGCLIALMYGAKQVEWYKAAIPKAIIAKGTPNEIQYEEGMEKVRLLYSHPVYSAIAAEVGLARPEILAQWPNRTQRRYITEMGKRILSSEDERTIMAWLLQGVEAKMLYIAIDIYRNQWALLKYDGFTTFTKIDTSLMISRIQEELGITVTIEESVHKNEYQLPEARKIIPVKSGKTPTTTQNPPPPTHPHQPTRKIQHHLLTDRERR